MDINDIVKNRLLNEKRFFLNKSNSKWISIGILPGYEPINGSGFVVEARIDGNGTNFFSLGQPAESGFGTLAQLLRTAVSGIPSPSSTSTGITINQFVMNNTPCFKITQRNTNQSICLGYTSVQALFEMEESIKKYLRIVDSKAAENAFLVYLDDQESEELDVELETNFLEFVQLCAQVKMNNDGALIIPEETEEDAEGEEDEEVEEAEEAIEEPEEPKPKTNAAKRNSAPKRPRLGPKRPKNAPKKLAE